MGRNKKISLAMLILALISLSLSGCARLTWDTTGAGKIVPPQNTICPLEGYWQVVDDYTVERPYSPIQGSKEDYLGMTMRFANDAVELQESLWQKPNYKVKYVDLAEYMLSKYLELPEEILPAADQVSVITVSSAESFIGEFLKFSDQEAIALLQNRVLHLKKTTGEVPGNGGELKNRPDTESEDKDYMNAAGALLALKTPLDPQDPFQGFEYRTLWIAAEKRKLHPILESPDIFFPRLSGFWEIKKVRIKDNSKSEERLLAYDLSNKRPELIDKSTAAIKQVMSTGSSAQGNAPQSYEVFSELDSSFWQEREGVLVQEIAYLGTDYLTFELRGTGKYSDRSDRSWTAARYMTLSLDNISADKGIKVSDLLGEKGFAAWQSAYNQQAEELRTQGYFLAAAEEEENFGLVREIGRWFLKGRINYLDGSHLKYREFGFNHIPPSKLVSYDILYVPWQNIKERVPEAVDAYTSPNQDFAIVLTKNRLLVFQIVQNQLHGNPLAEVSLAEGETVIMAEWATGLYVDDWEKSFQRYKAPRTLTEAVEK